MNHKINILIVEDEIMIAEDIAMRLGELGYHVAGIVDNVDDAIVSLEETEADVLLIDISLRGNKTGIDLAQVVNERFKVPFIFLTSLANQNIVEKAQKVNPAAYLLKPFNDRQVKVAIDMALLNFYGENHKPGTESLNEDNPDTHDYFLKMQGSLFLKKSGNYKKVQLKDILWLEADSNYTVIYTRSEKYTYASVLKSFEEKLPSDDFIRVHRSYIVNITNVTGFEGPVLFIGDKRIPVNKACQDLVFKRFRIV